MNSVHFIMVFDFNQFWLDGRPENLNFSQNFWLFWHHWHPWVCILSDLKQIWAVPSTVAIIFILKIARTKPIFFCESLKVVWSSTWPLSKAIIQISNVLVFFSGKSIQSLTVSQSLSLSHFQDYWVLEFQAIYLTSNYFTGAWMAS